MAVHDVDRPDVGGVPPKMQAIKELVVKELTGLLPFLSVTCDDNITSNITIRGTKEPKEQWANGIFHNATYFIGAIGPMNEKRYYDPADPKVTVGVGSVGSRDLPKFRKYTASPEKVVAKLKEWIMSWAPDKCEICKGAKGGQLGNENIVEGVVMCDHCHAQYLRDKETPTNPK